MSVGLVIWRLPLLRSQNQLESFFSREAAFLFNNLILLGICFTIFWGTIFPVISEWVRGVKITVGPPFFNKVNAPLGLSLLFLTGIGPIIAWRRATPRNLQRNFAGPLAFGFASGLALFALGMRQLAGLVSFSLCSFVTATIALEFYRGARARQTLVGESAVTALAHLVSKNHRRYGGYVIHLGIVLVFLGITGSSLFKDEVQATVAEGQTFSIGRYQLRFDRLTKEDSPHLSITRAEVTVLRAGQSSRRAPAGKALLQAARAANDGGGDSQDPPRGPLSRARRSRSVERARHVSNLLEPPRVLALDRRRRDDDRHSRGDDADTCGATRARDDPGAGDVGGAIPGRGILSATPEAGGRLFLGSWSSRRPARRLR